MNLTAFPSLSTFHLCAALTIRVSCYAALYPWRLVQDQVDQPPQDRIKPRLRPNSPRKSRRYPAGLTVIELRWLWLHFSLLLFILKVESKPETWLPYFSVIKYLKSILRAIVITVTLAALYLTVLHYNHIFRPITNVCSSLRSSAVYTSAVGFWQNLHYLTCAVAGRTKLTPSTSS